MRDVKDCIDFLEKNYPEEILRVSDEIDPRECDHAAWQEVLAKERRYPWVIFENVKTWEGKRWPGSFTNVSMSTFKRVALLYGLDLSQSTPFDLIMRHYQGWQNPCPPEIIEKREAPVKEVVLSGKDATFTSLPIWRNASEDSRPGWLTPIWIVKDPETGRYNYSWHRGQCLNEAEMTVRFVPGRHIHYVLEKYKKMGRNMPAVGVLGHHPAFYAAGSTSYPLELDESHGVSGIMKKATGKELRLTPSESWGKEFLVPADAELILEGEIDAERVAEAGPWCDAWRFYTSKVPMPVFKLSTMTMRTKPILEGVIPKYHLISHITYAADAYAALKPRFPGVKGVFIPFLQSIIVSYKPTLPGESANLALSLYQLGLDRVKHVIIVDEEINIYDMEDLFYAIVTRVDARRSVQIVTTITHPNDPCAKDSHLGRPLQVGGLIIDATKPYDGFPKEGWSPLERRGKIEKQAQRALDRSGPSSKFDWNL